MTKLEAMRLVRKLINQQKYMYTHICYIKGKDIRETPVDISKIDTIHLTFDVGESIGEIQMSLRFDETYLDILAFPHPIIVDKTYTLQITRFINFLNTYNKTWSGRFYLDEEFLDIAYSVRIPYYILDAFPIKSMVNGVSTPIDLYMNINYLLFKVSKGMIEVEEAIKGMKEIWGLNYNLNHIKSINKEASIEKTIKLKEESRIMCEKANSFLNNVLLFDLTYDNLKANEADKENITSGRNILKDIIKFINSKFSDSNFVKSIKIECNDLHHTIKNEEMSNILGMSENNLCFYRVYNYSLKREYSKTTAYLNTGKIGEYKIIANEKMFEGTEPIFEIRYKIEDKWSSWQGIAGKFILAKNSEWGPSGIAGRYSSITEEEIEIIKQKFQIRYSGSIVGEFVKKNTLPRIINDPFYSDIRKVIDPTTFHILFDSLVIQEVPNDKSYEIWMKFQERYR